MVHLSKEFYKDKISSLSDEKLLKLLEISFANEIGKIAYNQAKNRKLDLDKFKQNLLPPISDIKVETKPEDLDQLKKWNWGALFLGGLWAFTNGLDIWAIFCFIPGVNLLVALFLGWRGNVLAWKKSKLSIDDFVKLQDYWSKWGIGIFLVVFFLSLILGFVREMN